VPSHPERVLRGAAGEVFEVLGELGRGAMGVVLRARDRAAGREVALKLALEAPESSVRRTRFEREGEITASLTHPGIVRVYAAGTIDRRPYLAYELVEGARTLAEVLDAGGSQQALDILEQVGRALGYAHARGVVHRDVKPDNILVDATGRARVADFGLALAHDLERLTQTGTWVGTPNYTAPEQLHGPRSEVGAQADVWSLGVILYEVLTGELPFVAPSLLELGARITSGSFQRPSDLRPGVSPALEAVCVQALRARPELRFADGAAFADAVARGRTRPTIRRRRRAGWFAASLAALGAAAGAARLLTAPAPPARETAGPPSVEQTAASAARLLEGGDPGAAERLLAPHLEAAAPEVLLLAARARIAGGDPEGALDLLNRAPAGGRRGLLRLQAHVLAGAGDAALAAAAEAEGGPGEVALWRGRGQLLAGDCAAAARDLERAWAAGRAIDGDLVAVEVAARLAELVELADLVHRTVPDLEPRLRVVGRLSAELDRLAARAEGAAPRLGAFRARAVGRLQTLLWTTYPLLFEQTQADVAVPALERFERLEPDGPPADALRVLIAWCHRHATLDAAPMLAALDRVRGPLAPRVAFVAAALRSVAALTAGRRPWGSPPAAADLAQGEAAHALAPALPLLEGGALPAGAPTRDELGLLNWLCDALAEGYEAAAWDARGEPARLEGLRRRALEYSERVLEVERLSYGEVRDEDDVFRLARLCLLGGDSGGARGALEGFTQRLPAVWVPRWQVALAECDLQAGRLAEAAARLLPLTAIGGSSALVDALTASALVRALSGQPGAPEALALARRLRGSRPCFRWRSVAETEAQIEEGWRPGAGAPFSRSRARAGRQE